MDVGELILLIYLPLIFGGIIFLTDYIVPVIGLILGLGVYRGSVWQIFFGFLLSFSIFRMALSLLIKVEEIPIETVHTIGSWLLLLIGLLLIFLKPRAWVYAVLLGFIWSFWVGLSKAVFADYYEPKWIESLEVYLTLMSSLLPAIILAAIGFILSKLYPAAYPIEKGAGIVSVVIALLMLFHVVTIKSPREGLRPKEPPPQTLKEIFNLP